MKLSTVMAATKYQKKRRLYTLGLIITFLLSITFGVVTFYGQQTGNFVMNVDYDAYNRGIVLSDTKDFEQTSSRLMTDPIVGAQDITYNWLQIEQVKATDGHYNDPDMGYMAYTFYIKNNGLETVDLTYSVRITEVTKDLDQAIRFMIIVDDEESIYQQPDEADEFGNFYEYPVELPETKPFLNDYTIARETITRFVPEETKKFSIILWLEGYDPDTTDEVAGGAIKMQMSFSI